MTFLEKEDVIKSLETEFNNLMSEVDNQQDLESKDIWDLLEQAEEIDCLISHLKNN